MAIEDDGEVRESESAAAFDSVEIPAEKGFDASIGGAVDGVESFEAMVVGAEESWGSEPVMVFEERWDGETVCEEFQDDIAGDAGAAFCLLCIGVMGNEADGFFEVADSHFGAPEKQKGMQPPDGSDCGAAGARNRLQVRRSAEWNWGTVWGRPGRVLCVVFSLRR